MGCIERGCHVLTVQIVLGLDSVLVRVFDSMPESSGFKSMCPHLPVGILEQAS